MSDQGNRSSVTPERVALFAAACGLLCSAVGLSAYIYVAHHSLAGVDRHALESLFVLIWPTSILMLGAQSIQGQVVLFVLSASFNAGYFGAIGLILAHFASKLRSLAPQPRLAPARPKEHTSALRDVAITRSTL